MRSRSALVALVVLLVAAGTGRADSLEDQIKEYCAPNTPGATRAAILERLGKAGPSRTRQPFKHAAPACDPTALAALLVALEHPDTLDLVRPRLGGADDAAITSELAAWPKLLPDLVDLWEKAPAAGERSAILGAAFAARPEGLPAERFARGHLDKDRPEVGRAVVAWHLALPDDAKLEDVKEEWDRVAAVWSSWCTTAGRYPRSRRAQMEDTGRIRPRGPNAFLAPGAKAELVVDDLQTASHELLVRVCFDRGDGVVRYGGDDPVVVRRRGPKVVVSRGGREVQVDHRGGWLEVCYRVEVTDARRNRRRLWVFVDGAAVDDQPFAADGGQPLRLRVEAREGSLVLGDVTAGPRDAPDTKPDGRLR